MQLETHRRAIRLDVREFALGPYSQRDDAIEVCRGGIMRPEVAAAVFIVVAYIVSAIFKIVVAGNQLVSDYARIALPGRVGLEIGPGVINISAIPDPILFVDPHTGHALSAFKYDRPGIRER